MSATSELNLDCAIAIVYDGECPFCSRYLMKLRAAAGGVILVDARNGGPIVEMLIRKRYELPRPPGGYDRVLKRVGIQY